MAVSLLTCSRSESRRGEDQMGRAAVRQRVMGGDVGDCQAALDRPGPGARSHYASSSQLDLLSPLCLALISPAAQMRRFPGNGRSFLYSFLLLYCFVLKESVNSIIFEVEMNMENDEYDWEQENVT